MNEICKICGLTKCSSHSHAAPSHRPSFCQGHPEPERIDTRKIKDMSENENYRKKLAIEKLLNRTMVHNWMEYWLNEAFQSGVEFERNKEVEK